MKKFKNHTLKEYVSVLSKREAVPGGGSAAALTGATAVGLLVMVARYSKGRKKNTPALEKRIEKTIQVAESIKNDLLQCVDDDAQAYLKVVKAKQGTKREQKIAQNAARRVPKEVARLCYKAIKLAPFLVEKGNPYLLSDVAVAAELLLAAHQAANILSKS